VKAEIGGVRLDVDRGSECRFHQRLVSVYAEGGGGGDGGGGSGGGGGGGGGGGEGEGEEAMGRREWVELGDVRERMVCTLDVDDLKKRKERGDRVQDEDGDVVMMQDIKVKEEKQ